MLRMLSMSVFLVGAIFLHAWLYLYAELDLWQLLGIFAAETLLVLLFWRAAVVVRLVAAPLRLLIGLFQKLAGKIVALLHHGTRRLGCWLLMRWQWWRLPGKERVGRAWYWVMADHDVEMDQARQVQGEIRNNQWRLSLWHVGKATIVRQRNYSCSPTTGEDLPDTEFVRDLVDNTLVSRLGRGRCAGVTYHMAIPDENLTDRLQYEKWLSEDLEVLVRRLRRTFPGGVPYVTLMMDIPEMARDLAELLPILPDGDTERVVLWPLTCQPRGRRHLNEAVEKVRIDMLKGCADPVARIKALRLPARFLIIDAALRAVYKSIAGPGQRWRVAIRYHVDRSRTDIGEFLPRHGVIRNQSVADLWQDRPEAVLEPACARVKSSHRFLVPTLICGLLLILSIQFLHRHYELDDVDAGRGPELNIAQPNWESRLIRHHESLQASYWLSWLPFPGDRLLGWMLQERKAILARQVYAILDRNDPSDGGYQDLLRRLLQRHPLIRGRQIVSVDRSERDLDWLLAEVCNDGGQARLCRGRDLIRAHALLSQGDLKSGSAVPVQYGGHLTLRRSEYWLEIFDNDYRSWSPLSDGPVVPYACTKPGLEKLRVLLELSRRYQLTDEKAGNTLPGEISSRCRGLWKQTASNLGESCSVGDKENILGPESVQSRFLLAAAEVTRTLDVFAEADPETGLFQPIALLEQLSPGIHGRLSAAGNTILAEKLPRQGLQWFSEVRRRWQLRTKQATSSVARRANSFAGAEILYGDYLSALYRLQERLGETGSALSAARETLDSGNGSGPLVGAWGAMESLAAQRSAGDWSEPLASLMRCRIRSLWRRTLNKVADHLQNRWRDLAGGIPDVDLIDRMQRFYGPDGYLNVFAREELQPFIYRHAGSRSFNTRQKYGLGVPLQGAFLQALSAAATGGNVFNEIHRIGVVINPVAVNREAQVSPHRLKISMQCPEPKNLEAGNYRIQGALLWQPGVCGEVKIQIHIGKQILVHRYAGQSGMLKFVSDYSRGYRVLKRGDFSIKGGGTMSSAIRELVVRLDISLPPNMHLLLDAVRTGIPDSPV